MRTEVLSFLDNEWISCSDENFESGEGRSAIERFATHGFPRRVFGDQGILVARVSIGASSEKQLIMN